jgi:hypothetical protein
MRRPNRLDHEVCLDEFALQLVKDWLIERHRRWPLSANPHLIVSPITAMHVDRPAVGISNFQALRDRIGINFTKLRQDRFSRRSTRDRRPDPVDALVRNHLAHRDPLRPSRPP